LGEVAVDEDLIAQIIVVVAELEGKVNSLKALVGRLVKGG
jgi:hypothetical protein